MTSYKLISPASLNSITTVNAKLICNTRKQGTNIALNLPNVTNQSNQSLKHPSIVSLKSSDAADSIKEDSLQPVCNTRTQGSNIALNFPNVANQPNQSFKSPRIVSLKSSDAADSIKEDSLQQLSSNALSPYKPSHISHPLAQDFEDNQEMHCCTDCGDTFLLKSSLTFHLERRSVLIKFPCELCKSSQIFYNRCTLLSHVRSHTEKGGSLGVNKAVVSPLPRVFMDGIHSDFVNNLEEEFNFESDHNDTTPANLLELSIIEMDNFDDKEAELEVSPESSTSSSNIPVQKEMDEISLNKVKCYDCDHEFESVSARKEHLTNGDKIPAITDKELTLCTKCGILCPSKCSFKAHQRTHLQVSPYICPECGESPNPYWDQFQAHLKYTCFHFSRAIGLKCPVCKRVVKNRESLQKHMELHTELYAKCDNCPRAFKSPASFIAHKRTFHDGASVTYHIIYKCAFCDVVFLTKDRMLAHKDEHLKEQVREYIFNCFLCGKALDSKLKLLEHLRACHTKTYKMNTGEDGNISKRNNNEYIGRVECMLCHSSYPTHLRYISHLARSHKNTNIPCSYCFSAIAHRKEMISHGKKHLLKGDFLCLLCHNRKFDQKIFLKSHLYTHVTGLKYCSSCPICDERLPTKSKALNHLQTEHFVEKVSSDPKRGEANENVSYGSIGQACQTTLENEVNHQRHTPDKPGTKTYSKKQGENDSLSEEPLLKRQRPPQDTCAKCNFKSSDRTEFKKHILMHKVNKNTFQCQDCGLCFIVQPSLTKHLRIAHKVYNVEKYIEEEGTNFSPDKNTASSSSDVYALTCSVCSNTFLTESALKTHMRSHGMAFIQAKKSIIS